MTDSQAPQVVLKANKHVAVLNRHPWVLAKSLEPASPPPPDGAEVDVLGSSGRWLARGIYNGKSHIRVRLYSWKAGQLLDDAFWRQRIESALRLRQEIGYNDPQGAARLVFSEADSLGGLIVDRYGEFLVVQLTALATAVRAESLVKLLAEATGARGIFLRTDRKIAEAEGMEPRDGLAWGQTPEASIEIHEAGLRYRVELAAGQKTGFYLDQRENRLAAARYMAGRRVLDVCCYVGGFSLTAARLGLAREVLGIDASQRAVEQARRHASENGVENVRFEVADCFQELESLAGQGQRFGAVILDPPRFAGSRRSIDQALAAYHRLNRLGVQLLEPGGILVSCSCSGRVTREDFRQMLFGVAQKTRRDLQILEQRGASPDHPVSVSCPETEYLKCFICRAG